MSKPLPKSLHTVTVLVRVATHIRKSECLNIPDCVATALDILGYTDENTPDTYGLVTAAIKQMAATHDL